MAVDMFIKIAGIPGESKDHKHKEEIDVLAWGWGMSNSGNAQMGGGQGAGKANVQDLNFTKYIDKSTPPIQLSCLKGSHIGEATLVVRKAGGDNPVEYLTITMQDLIVTSVSTGGSQGEERLTENVSLNFAKVKVKYVEQTEKGGEGAKPDMGWDIRINKAM
ncbi:MAG: Hcp family type VI secretion system effector [Gammaproteobacteria bacterium]